MVKTRLSNKITLQDVVFKQDLATCRIAMPTKRMAMPEKHIAMPISPYRYADAAKGAIAKKKKVV